MKAIVNAKYKYFAGRAAWTVAGHSKRKNGLIKHNQSFCADVADTRYLTQKFTRAFGWGTAFIDWL